MNRVLGYLREVLFILGDDRRKLPALGCAILLSATLDSVGIGLIGPFVALAMNPGVLETTSAGHWVCTILGSSSPPRAWTR